MPQPAEAFVTRVDDHGSEPNALDAYQCVGIEHDQVDVEFHKRDVLRADQPQVLHVQPHVRGERHVLLLTEAHEVDARAVVRSTDPLVVADDQAGPIGLEAGVDDRDLVVDRHQLLTAKDIRCGLHAHVVAREVRQPRDELAVGDDAGGTARNRQNLLVEQLQETLQRRGVQDGAVSAPGHHARERSRLRLQPGDLLRILRIVVVDGGVHEVAPERLRETPQVGDALAADVAPSPLVGDVGLDLVAVDLERHAGELRRLLLGCVVGRGRARVARVELAVVLTRRVGVARERVEFGVRRHRPARDELGHGQVAELCHAPGARSGGDFADACHLPLLRVG